MSLLGVKVKRWTDDEDRLLIENVNLATQELCGLLGRSKDSIGKRKEFLHIYKNRPFTIEQDTFIIENYYKLTWDQMAEKLPFKVGRIRHRAKFLGLDDPDRDQIIQNIIQTRYSFNKDYFKIPNEFNSYWSGFIAGDGCLYKHRHERRTLEISLSSKDHAHLEKFAKDIEFNGPVRKYMLKNKYKHNPNWKQESEMSSLQINCNKELFDDLYRNFNLTPKKSLTLGPPNLTKDEYILPFIKGLIDSDGTISVQDQYWYTQIVGTYAILKFVKEVYDRIFPHTINTSTIAQVNKTPYKIFSYKIKGERAERILDTLSLLDCQSLDRKWIPYEGRNK